MNIPVDGKPGVFVASASTSIFKRTQRGRNVMATLRILRNAMADAELFHQFDHHQRKKWLGAIDQIHRGYGMTTQFAFRKPNGLAELDEIEAWARQILAWVEDLEAKLLALQPPLIVLQKAVDDFELWQDTDSIHDLANAARGVLGRPRVAVEPERPR